nr:hypothetical protein [Ralstonia sp. A12]
MVVMTLRDGKYLASCKERNALSAAMNGHGAVFPQARCTVAKGLAIFDRDGKEVWRCNSAYAETHFRLERIE